MFWHLSQRANKKALMICNGPDLDLVSSLKGMGYPPGPFELKRHMGAKANGDVVGFPVSQFAITQDKYAALLETGLSGLKFEPAVLNGQPYQIVCVTGGIGPLERNRAKRAPKALKIPNNDTRIGLILSEETWDQSDCFVPDGTTFILVNQRGKSVFESIFGDWFTFEPVEDVLFYM